MVKELIFTHIFKLRTYSEQDKLGFLNDNSQENPASWY